MPHDAPTTPLEPLPEVPWFQRHGFNPPELAELDAESHARTHGEPTDEDRPKPLTFEERTRNPLRPAFLIDIIGQRATRRHIGRMIDNSKARGEALPHVLLVGPAGTGKTTFANCIANELGAAQVFQLQAPISFDTLVQLQEHAREGDVVFIDEIHQQAVQERRGTSTMLKPEVLFGVLEDRTLTTPRGVLPFPHVTFIGATTDEGMLPDPFVDRFTIRPHLEPYSEAELGAIALDNAKKLGRSLDIDAAEVFAKASRGVPRQINNYVKQAAMLTLASNIDLAIAQEVVHDLNHTTDDGLTADMQKVLRFLLLRGKRVVQGETIYSASLSSIATAIGKSRDSKAVQLRIEPYLIELGFLQVGHGGRRLTDAGIARAQRL